MPGTVEIGFEPSREVHRRMRWRDTDVTKIAGAISRRNVHASAKRQGQMCEITAHPPSLLERLPGGSGRTSVCVVKYDVVVNEVADRLHARPSRRRATKQLPRDLGQSDSIAISAS